ncbi:carbohydrate ABC transporter permease [Paenibacillus antri]|uniref:Carbohydrate ABC transporter permease n=1 Tax=Paenibacillus antri TaxID=2582848 RepID=A0A5R9GCJ5_9BACL|nr:carbohydrate ABC transporter permease [Paenibacillus antri]TLS50874.1 carbohydrate ABC transporter permease [Paenibacillus antri]
MYVERFKSGSWVVTRSILLVGLIFVVLYPILVKVSTVFKDKADIYNPTVVWIPENFTLDNIRVAYEIMEYWPTLFNTFALSAVTMLLQLASCALAGYGFAKLKSKWGNALFAGVVLTILIPPQTFIVPLYLHFRYFDFLGAVQLVSGERGINLIDTYWPFLLTAATGNALKSGLYIYIFRQFFLGLSKELEEAAFVDGAGVFGSFARIVLPTSIPAIVTVSLFSFVWQWNDTFFTGNFLTESQVLSKELLALPSNVGNYLLFEAPGASLSNSANIDPFYASMLVDTGLLLAILPLIVMYLFVQRFFVESIERTGIVG